MLPGGGAPPALPLRPLVFDFASALLRQNTIAVPRVAIERAAPCPSIADWWHGAGATQVNLQLWQPILFTPNAAHQVINYQNISRNKLLLLNILYI
jgi:hypothetical protein